MQAHYDALSIEIARVAMPDVALCMSEQGQVYLTYYGIEMDLPYGLDRDERLTQTQEILEMMKTGETHEIFDRLVSLFNSGYHAGMQAAD